MYVLFHLLSRPEGGSVPTVCIAISRSSLTGPQLPGSNPSLPAVHCAGETESETTQGATVEPFPWVTGWVVPTLGNSDASSATAINAGPPSRPWCRGLTGMVSGSRCSPDRCIRVRCIIVILLLVNGAGLVSLRPLPQPQPLIAAISARSSRTQKSSLTQ